ncbi:MAG: hypothetical protein WC712_12380, partial [Candidatus Brocadiia bacterium]
MRKRPDSRFILALVILLGMASLLICPDPAACDASRDMCSVVFCSDGAATARAEGKTIALAIGSSIAPGSVIATTETPSPLTLAFADASYVIAGPSTNLVVEGLVPCSGIPGARSNPITLERGSLLASASPIAGEILLKVKGYSVRFTGRLEAVASVDDTSMYLLEGTGSITRGDQAIALAAGDGATLSKDAAAPFQGRPPALAKPLAEGLLKPGNSASPTIVVVPSSNNGSYALDASPSRSGSANPIVRIWWRPISGPVYPISDLTGPLLNFRAGDGLVTIDCYADDGLRIAKKRISFVAKSRTGTGTPPTVSVKGPTYCTTGASHTYEFAGISNPSGNPYAVRWAIAPEGAAQFSAKPGGITATFRNTGAYQVRATARDIYGAESFAVLNVRVGTVNTPPTAIGRLPVNWTVYRPLNLDSSSSVDPEESALSARWTVRTAPAPDAIKGLAGSGDSVVRFRRPGKYALVLSVSDGEQWSTQAEYSIDVTPYVGPPVIEVPEAVTALPDSTVVLDASRSWGATEAGPEISWRFLSGPPCRLLYPRAGVIEFFARFAGTYYFAAQTVEGDVKTVKVCRVEVKGPNHRPFTSILGPAKCSAGEKAVFKADKFGDEDGDHLTFFWTVTGANGLKIAEGTGPAFEFTPAAEGACTVSVVAHDGKDTSPAAAISLSVVKAVERPRIEMKILPEQPRSMETVTMDATATRSRLGGRLAFVWIQTGGPPVSLTGSRGAVCSFTPEYSATFRFLLRVDEEGWLWEQKDIEIYVKPGNSPPICAALSQIWVKRGGKFRLDGTLSYDPDGDKITLKWRQTAGQFLWNDDGVFHDPDMELEADEAGSFAFQLEVSDGAAVSRAETTVTVWEDEFPGPEVPAAYVSTPAEVRIELYAEVPRGTKAGRWNQVRGIKVPFESEGSVLRYAFAFVGVYEFAFFPTFNNRATPPQHFLVAVKPASGRPIVRLFGPAKAMTGEEIRLTAAVEGQIRSRPSFEWRQTAGPMIDSLAGVGKGEEISFKASQAGIYEFELVAMADGVRSLPIKHRLEVGSNLAQPLCDAGPDRRAEIGASVRLDASRCRQPGGGELTFEWTQIAGPAMILPEPARGPIFDLSLSQEGLYTFFLTASNGSLASSDDIAVRVFARNLPPQTKLECFSANKVGGLVILDASHTTDPNNDPLQFAFRQLSGPEVNIPAGTDSSPYCVFGAEEEGEYSFEVLADDGLSGSTAAVLIIKVAKQRSRYARDIAEISTDAPKLLPAFLGAIGDQCGREFLALPSLMSLYGAEKTVGPVRWRTSKKNAADYAAYLLGCYYRDPASVAQRLTGNVPREALLAPILLSRDYSFLDEEARAVTSYPYPGVTADNQMPRVLEMLKDALAPALSLRQFSLTHTG